MNCILITASQIRTLLYVWIFPEFSVLRSALPMTDQCIFLWSKDLPFLILLYIFICLPHLYILIEKHLLYTGTCWLATVLWYHSQRFLTCSVEAKWQIFQVENHTGKHTSWKACVLTLRKIVWSIELFATSQLYG